MQAAARRLVPELMDDPGLDADAHRAALAGLARINRVSGAAPAVWAAVRPKLDRARATRLVDVACGGGDVLAGVLQRAAAEGYDVTGVACDISPVALDATAERAAGVGVGVELRRLDALRDPLPAGCDAAVCSLFLHHLDRPDAVRLLRCLGDTVPAMVVDDLVRSRAGWVAARVGTRVLSRSAVVHVDGPRSVAAAFTADELRAMAGEAGLSGAGVEPRWPFRIMLTWSRA